MRNTNYSTVFACIVNIALCNFAGIVSVRAANYTGNVPAAHHIVSDPKDVKVIEHTWFPLLMGCVCRQKSGCR